MVSDLLIARMEKRIIDLESKLNLQEAALNFVLTHLIEVLDNKGDDNNKLSDELKVALQESLDKITSGSPHIIKRSINGLLQPSVRPMFSQQTEKFLK